MKRILLLTTGAPLPAWKPRTALPPPPTNEPLRRLLDELALPCKVDVKSLFHIGSTNFQPEHWLEIARAIRAAYAQYDGFVITHGTDTMAYTAAALSYLIQYSAKPIVLTGAQRP